MFVQKQVMLKNEKEGVYVVLINGVPHQDTYTSLQDACACGDVSYQLATRKKTKELVAKGWCLCFYT